MVCLRSIWGEIFALNFCNAQRGWLWQSGLQEQFYNHFQVSEPMRNPWPMHIIYRKFPAIRSN